MLNNDNAKPKETLPRKDTVKVRKTAPAKDTLITKSTPKVHEVKKEPATPKMNLTAKSVGHDLSKGKTVIRKNLKTEEGKTAPVKPADKVVFRVQIATSSKELSTHSKKFAGLPDIWRYQHQGLYKYTTGKESSADAPVQPAGRGEK